jgi:sulfoxide reductase catalytic subunit YedY
MKLLIGIFNKKEVATLAMRTKNIPSSQITPEEIYLSRRKFIKRLAMISAGSMIAASCNSSPSPTPSAVPDLKILAKDELGNPVNSYQDITGYNNYYEFAEDKSSPSRLAQGLKTFPWSLKVDGLVNNPKTYFVDDLKQKYPSEERIYRLRCVERWSMVIPWLGFSLNKLLKEVEPTKEAKFVRFETLMDPSQYPGQGNRSYPWPYIEGLRMDEAMHDLTILGTGLYGKDLTPQNGGPIRLVVPWKYGFKSIKAIVHIELVAEQPKSFWMNLFSQAYGFYANVNPDVPHPGWSQSTELRIGETKQRKTLLFNGYADQVTALYTGMDLTINY